MPPNLPSLRHRDFRIYTYARFVGNVGNNVQLWSVAWHVYEVSGHSSLHVGLLGLVRIVPLLMFSLVGGVAADHMDRKRLMVLTRVAMTVLAAALAAVTFSGVASLAWLYSLVALSSVARAFDGPARNALMVNLVPTKDLPNALSVNGIAWRLSDVVGPIITGAIILFAAIGWSYVFAVVANIVLIAGLAFVRPARQAAPDSTVKSVKDLFRQMGSGIQFVRRSTIVRNAMFIDFWATFFSSADALFPAFAGPVLNLGPSGYGLLAASSGVGALVAAVVLSLRPTIIRQGAWVIGMVGVYGMFTILFGLSQSLWMAMLFLACTGAADMVSTVLRQTIRQLATPDEMRGRMAGVSVLFQVGGPQLGDAEAGVLAKFYGDRASVVIGGCACLLVSGWYSLTGGLRG
ncbi:MAG: MFS transporter, partial [Armatimonadetes bacterium]|nr:MFS transporter [Armatimonadota bacterium]